MARTAKFKCSACDRTFAMAAHLGRHMSTVHAPKGKRAAPAAKAKRVKRPFKTPRLGGAAGLAAAVGDIQRYRNELAVQRAALDSQVPALDQAITALGGSVASVKVHRGGRGRLAFRAGTLPACIRQVLHAHRGPMAIKDIAAAVRRAGFKSRDKNLSHSVGKCLAAMPGVQKVGRGVYRAR
jgi:hypothetical protein